MQEFISDVDWHTAMDEIVNLEIGQAAPKFDCVDSKGNSHSLEEYNNNGKSVILYFYPKDSTSGCTTQACDFRDSMARLNNGNYVVLGVSKDSVRSHENFINKQELNFPLLMDEDISLHQTYGTWRQKSMYGKTYMGTSRSTFVIGADGNLTWVGYGVRTKGHVDKIMTDLGIEWGGGLSSNPPQNDKIALPNNSVAWSPCAIGTNLSIGDNCSIGALSHIGRDVVIGDNCRIQGCAYIADLCVLGKGVFIGPNATLLNDRFPPSGNKELWQPITINNGAVIGGGATIVPGCNVGENAVLAAGSVLTKNLPKDEVWAGNPAKYLMSRQEYEAKR